MPFSNREIIDAVEAAGVIGAGGGGFPAHVKIDAKADIVIANGSECEPLLYSDKSHLMESTDKIIAGTELIMEAMGAKQGYIAIKGHYQDVVNHVQQCIPSDSRIQVHSLDNYYPAGDEFLTVYDVSGRVIPEGGLPLDVGVVVSNVVSLAQISDAMGGKPVTERPVTIAGSVASPSVYSAPIGTPYRDLIRKAGGSLNPDDVIIDGGPMMGMIINDLDQGISKTTSGILSLPKNHFIVSMHRISISQMVKRSKAACCQCFRCSDLCPRNLLGHNLYPHKTMRTIDYIQSEPTEHITSAFLCSQCGVCELIACDSMLLSPRKIYAEYRQLLKDRGITNPHQRSGFNARESLPYGKVAIPVVLKKLGISEYAVPTPYRGDIDVTRVRVPLNRHTGAPAVPVVGTDDQVKRGDPIATIPEDQLGANYHASIPGKIIEITNEYIEIHNNCNGATY